MAGHSCLGCLLGIISRRLLWSKEIDLEAREFRAVVGAAVSGVGIHRVVYVLDDALHLRQFPGQLPLFLAPLGRKL